MKQSLLLCFCFCIFFLRAQQPETLIQLGHSDRVQDVQLTADAHYAVTGSTDNTVKLWDIGKGQLIRTFHGHRGSIYSVQLSDDAKTIYSCSWDDKRILKWDAITGKILKQYRNNTNAVSKMALSHNSKLLACRTDDNILLLNTSDLSIYKIIKITKPKLVQFSDDDKQLYVATDEYKKEKIITCDLNGTIVNSMNGIYSPEAMNVAAGKIILSNYQLIVCAELSTGKIILSIPKDSLRITYACLNKTGTLLAYALEDGSIYGLNINGEKIKDGNGAPFIFERTHYAIINHLQFSDDGKFLITASNDWSAKVLSMFTGKVIRTLATQSEYIQSLSLSGNGNYLAFASGNLNTGNHVGVWDLQKGKLLPFYPSESAGDFFSAVAFGARNKNIGSANTNGKLAWYSFPNDGNMGNLSMGNAAVTCVTLTPNAKNYIAGTKDGTIIFWRPDRNKSETIETDKKSGIASLAVSPDGANVLAGTFDGKLLVYSYETKSLLATINSHNAAAGYYDTSFVMAYGSVTGMSLDGSFAMLYASVMSVAYSPDNQLMAACGGSWIKIFEAHTGKLITHIKQNGAGFSSVAFSADGNYLCSGGADFLVRIYDVKSGALVKSFAGHQNEVRSVLFSSNQKYLISGSLDTQIKFWDIATGQELLSYIILRGGQDFVISNPQGYYFATKGAAKILTFRAGNEVYPFEQFDLKYNRPDIILKTVSRIAYDNETENPNIQLIKSYYVAYQKRLKRQGFEEAQLGNNLHLPQINITNEGIPLSTKNAVLNFKIKAEDNLYNLKSYTILVNDVPLYGAKGKAVSGKSVSEEVQVQLSNERNKISVLCINEKGVESYKETFEISYEGGIANYKTIFIGIGVSNYLDSNFNLKYAAKDVKDLAELAKDKNAEVLLLTNEQATKANILKLKNRLMQTSVNDKVIISLSGHGLLSKDLDFYYATYDIDFQHPEKNGLMYDDLENIMDGIPARNKLLMVDACHSGEIDKTENLSIAEGKPQEGVSGVSSRGSALIIDSNSVGLENSFELMQDLFSDISNGNGAVVISAAGGKEYALESAKWNNGVFTYCVLNAVKYGAADFNMNKKISISELRKYVSTQVQQLTGGKQKPTARKENLENDWNVF